MDKEEKIFNLEDEFVKIQKNLEHYLEVLCIDLHSITLSLKNFPKLKEITVPNPYLSYFLQRKHDTNSFIYHTKNNSDQILFRINNDYALSIINIFELHIKQAYGLMLALRKQISMKLTTAYLKETFSKEMSKYKTLGVLANEIYEKINKIDKKIMENEKQYYEYFENYILLRNCLAHKNGIISEDEVGLEIRLPVITQDQIQKAILGEEKVLNPQTLIRKWKLGEQIKLNLNEVEGIAYGLIKVSFRIIKHMYKAADKHFEGIEKAKK